MKNDPALARRFFEMSLKPLTCEQMKMTFTNNKARLFENKYQITLPENILERALEGSQKITGTYPDKGMRLLNLICAKASRSMDKIATLDHVKEALKIFEKPTIWSTVHSLSAKLLDPLF